MSRLVVALFFTVTVALAGDAVKVENRSGKDIEVDVYTESGDWIATTPLSSGKEFRMGFAQNSLRNGTILVLDLPAGNERSARFPKKNDDTIVVVKKDKLEVK